MKLFHESSRMTALKEGRKSIGASCNTFKVQDSITSIAEAHTWAYQVLAYQGAPSLDYSELRPVGSTLSSGGTSSGAVSFMQPFDSICATMRRTEKKNGAGIVYLDWKHPELQQFLAADFKAAYKAVYIPMHDTEEAQVFLSNKKMLKMLAAAYDSFKCFLVKRPEPWEGVELMTNLCTEVEIPHYGTCVLGAFNLAGYETFEDFKRWFSTDFTTAAQLMLDQARLAWHTQERTPLRVKTAMDFDANRQFGLGVFGLASALGGWGLTYEEIAGDHPFWSVLSSGYHAAADAVDPYVRAAFCIQPTVTTSQRAKDWRGFAVSPEIQPVIGLTHEDGVSTILKSAIHGDKVVTYAPGTQTIYDVDYDTYAIVSARWQSVMNSTGLAHRHSHCFYGSRFSVEQLESYYTDPLLKRIRSLYYRLPSKVNNEALKKDTLWQDVTEEELADFSVDALLAGGTCQLKGESDCECQG